MLRRLMMAAASGGGGGGSDPDFASVVSLLHFDGADGSTTFTDQAGKLWTPEGTTTLTTADKKFGSASGNFDGAGKNIRTSDSSDFDWRAGPYTIEAWVKISAYGGDGFDRSMMLGQAVATPGIYNWGLGPDRSGKLCFFYWDGSRVMLRGATVLPLGTWVHIAMTFDGSSIRLFVNGALDGTFAYTSAATPTAGIDFRVGFTDPSRCNFLLDELRIIKGVARYTANFTPPTAPFPNS